MIDAYILSRSKKQEDKLEYETDKGESTNESKRVNGTSRYRPCD